MKKSLLLVIILLISACAVSTEEKFSKIKEGEVKESAISILGEPTDKVPFFFGTEFWYYGDNSMIIVSGDTIIKAIADLKKFAKDNKEEFAAMQDGLQTTSNELDSTLEVLKELNFDDAGLVTDGDSTYMEGY